MKISEKLKTFILKKLISDLRNISFHPYGREIWLINSDDKIWYFVMECDGTLWFNQKVFNNFFHLFSLNSTEYSPILKEWFESLIDVSIRTVSRKNTDYDYIIEGVLRRSNSKYDWSLENRFGFGYQVVKKYLDIKKVSKGKEIRVFDYYL
jgi:hypothetical protein